MNTQTKTGRRTLQLLKALSTPTSNNCEPLLINDHSWKAPEWRANKTASGFDDCAQNQRPSCNYTRRLPKQTKYKPFATKYLCWSVLRKSLVWYGLQAHRTATIIQRCHANVPRLANQSRFCLCGPVTIACGYGLRLIYHCTSKCGQRRRRAITKLAVSIPTCSPHVTFARQDHAMTTACRNTLVSHQAQCPQQ